MFSRHITVIPEPKRIKIKGKQFEIDKNVRIEVEGITKSAELIGMASLLKKKVEEKLNISLNMTRGEKERSYIRLKISDSAELSKLGTEGYKLHVSRQGITVSSSAPQGVFYGLQTLLQIIDEKGRVIPCLEIEDWPDLKMRGLFISLIIQLPRFHHLLNLIEKMSRYKLNTLVIQYDDKFPYRTDPLIQAARTLTENQIKRLLKSARRHYIEVIPLLQALNFQQYVLRHSKYSKLRHREFMYNSVRGEACPQQRQTLNLFKSLYREILNMHGAPRYFHVGGDEQLDLSGCPRCEEVAGKKGEAYLYFDYFKKVLNFVKMQGQTPLIWADMLLGGHKQENKKQFLQMAHKYIPSETIACDWDYGTEDTTSKKRSMYGMPGFSHFDLLVKKGRLTLAVPAIKSANDGTDSINFNHCLKNIKGFCQKSAHAGGLGVLNTLWPNTGRCQLEWISERTTCWNEVIGVSWDQRRPPMEANWYGIVCGAEYSWSADKINLGQFSYKFIREFWGIENKDCLKAVHNVGLKVYVEDAPKRAEELKNALTILESVKKQVKKNLLSFEHMSTMGKIHLHKAQKLVLFKEIEDNKESPGKLLKKINNLYADMNLLVKDLNALYLKTLYPEEIKEEVRLRYQLEKEYIEKYRRGLQKKL